MKNISLMFIVPMALLALPACFDAEAPKTQTPDPVVEDKVVTVQEPKEPVKKPCEHGDTYPFSKCGKDPSKWTRLPNYPRALPSLAWHAPVNDLRTILNPLSELQGEWIGRPWLKSDENDNVRIHWRFHEDGTFIASVFENTYITFTPLKRGQLFRLISGTYSEEDGILLLHLSEKLEPVSFASMCWGRSWMDANNDMVLKIPVSFHEDKKTLALHESDGKRLIANVLVKIEN